MASSAYSRTLKPSPWEPRSKYDAKPAKNVSKIETRKLGIGLVAVCCLLLLTYVSTTMFFAINSPVITITTMPVTEEASAGPMAETISISQPEGTEDGLKNATMVEIKPISEENFPKVEPIAEKNDIATTDRRPISGETFPEIEPIAEKESVKVEEIASPHESDAAVKTKPQLDEKEVEAVKIESKLTCDDKGVDKGFPYARPVVCEMSGDIRISSRRSTVALVTSSSRKGIGERRIRPYARNDDFLLPGIKEVILKPEHNRRRILRCTANHSAPAVVFSVGGYTGNFFHDMADVIIPLFLTSYHFKGEVHFLVTNYRSWWIRKYRPVLTKLSRHEVINFDADKEVHCFRHAIVGLIRDRDLIIHPNPKRNPRKYSMLDFTKFLRRAYSLKRNSPAILGEYPGKRPRMLIISRTGTRKLVNKGEVAAMAEELGFEVVVAEAGGDVSRFARVVNSCDVLLAVHGAGMTNQVFLPTKAVVIQVIPWGKMDWMAENFYGRPAVGMKLRYLEYYVAEEESSLVEQYPRDHMVFKNPMAVHGQGWKALSDMIMAQDLKVNLKRFRPTLLQALNLLQD
ncbi:beta-1,2-xylosyltransferease XAX1-like [Typha angustifolia]|uniref:beta-1,2-xylosyltransferease XAX1-like n=1 Tax=Typha angustifolia TaxID=59011 RepID=UPI003C2BC5E2